VQSAAEQRLAARDPALRVRRHGDGAVPAHYRGTAPDSPAAGGGHVDGLHAQLLGRSGIRTHGRGGRPRCIPTQIAGRNRMWRRMIIDDIRADSRLARRRLYEQPRACAPRSSSCSPPAARPGAAAPRTQPRLGRCVHHSLARHSLRRDRRERPDVPGDASRDYDPSAALDRVTVPVLAINSADDFINPPELGLMER